MGNVAVLQALFRSVMSMYEGAKTRVRVDCECHGSLRLKFGCTIDLCYHILFF